jgi:hypothetical protein
MPHVPSPASKKPIAMDGLFTSKPNGAGKEARTLDLYLGKVSLYQLSYSRVSSKKNPSFRMGFQTGGWGWIEKPAADRIDSHYTQRRSSRGTRLGTPDHLGPRGHETSSKRFASALIKLSHRDDLDCCIF